MPKLYTIKDLAELFRRDAETIYRWIKEGDVFPNAFKVKDGWYVPHSDIKKLIKKNADQSEAKESKQSRSPRQSPGFVTGWK